MLSDLKERVDEALDIYGDIKVKRFYACLGRYDVIYDAREVVDSNLGEDDPDRVTFRVS